MEITKVNKDEIISVGREALGKVRNNELDVLDNITLTLALIIGAGLDTGYKIRIPFYEFSDYSGLITKVAKAESCIAVISIPRNPPLRSGCIPLPTQARDGSSPDGETRPHHRSAPRYGSCPY